MKRSEREGGVALIVALMILFMAVSVAGLLGVREYMAIKRTAAVIDQAQALQYLYGVEEWVGASLQKQIKHTAWISLDQTWAKPLPPTPIGEEGADTLEGYVEDLQGRFNLNNLIKNGKVDPLAQARFTHLLEALNLPETLVQSVTGWMGLQGGSAGYDGVGTQGAYYLGLTPPYTTANQPFTSITTLRLVHGFTPAIYDKIAPSLCVLPPGTAINVNTASATVLRAIGLDQAQAKAVISARKQKPFTTLQAFEALPVLSGLKFNRVRLAVKSRYFAVHSRIMIGDETTAPYVSTLMLSPSAPARVLARTIAYESPQVGVVDSSAQSGSGQ